MEVEFGEKTCDRLEIDPKYTADFSASVVSAFRKRLQQIRAALDERDLYASGGMHFKKLQGARAHQFSIRLNDQWRLIVELRGKGSEKVVYVVGIEDYH